MGSGLVQDLGIEIGGSSIRTRGRASKALSAEIVREVEDADLALLDTERGIKSIPIKKLRDSHHALAKCLANGMKPAQASIITGYGLSRISILQADPSFRELLEFYRDTKETAFADMQERMSTLSMDALEELRDRLNEEPENFKNTQLIELVTKLADRTGHGAQTKQTIDVSINLAERLQAARTRAGLVVDES